MKKMSQENCTFDYEFLNKASHQNDTLAHSKSKCDKNQPATPLHMHMSNQFCDRLDIRHGGGETAIAQNSQSSSIFTDTSKFEATDFKTGFHHCQSLHNTGRNRIMDREVMLTTNITQSCNNISSKIQSDWDFKDCDKKQLCENISREADWCSDSNETCFPVESSSNTNPLNSDNGYNPDFAPRATTKLTLNFTKGSILQKFQLSQNNEPRSINKPQHEKEDKLEVKLSDVCDTVSGPLDNMKGKDVSPVFFSMSKNKSLTNTPYEFSSGVKERHMNDSFDTWEGSHYHVEDWERSKNNIDGENRVTERKHKKEVGFDDDSDALWSVESFTNTDLLTPDIATSELDDSYGPDSELSRNATLSLHFTKDSNLQKHEQLLSNKFQPISELQQEKEIKQEIKSSNRCSNVSSHAYEMKLEGVSSASCRMPEKRKSINTQDKLSPCGKLRRVADANNVLEGSRNPGQTNDEEGLRVVGNNTDGEIKVIKEKHPSHEVEFDILDEVDLGGEDDNEEVNGDSLDGSDSDILEDEVDAMLEQGLQAARQKKIETSTAPTETREGDDVAHIERHKVVLKVRGHDHFDMLPEGWIEVGHNSGMPVYLHRQTRVCTLSKPYFLGPGSARKHDIPVSSVPCLHYKRELEKENETSLNIRSAGNEQDIEEESLSAAETIPRAKVESLQESKKEQSIDPQNLHEYCSRLFQFQTITVRRFRTWAGRRKHQKMIKQRDRPTLPEGTKLITCPLPSAPDKGSLQTSGTKREFIMNPSGKSFICILHEYVQHAMKLQPRYIFKELENASMPYGATVIINDMEYGTGYGSSKKQAKSEAARATLEVLIPQMKHVTIDNKKIDQEQQDVAFFDEIRIEDPRINDLCVKAGQPSPYQILLECLKRNYGMGDTQIKIELKSLKHQKNEFTMTVGKQKATVLCKNKRDGKQRASQAILQGLHPHIACWGSLLRLYGIGSCKTLKEKKEEEQRITELQSKACAHKPNYSILNKLKQEMLKLKARREAVKPIGKFIPQNLEILPSPSTSNLNNVDL
ncbi:microprocessor complex subunit partner of drosha [Tachypleus tridentatus]|uniref:microprocessor complex subunit partner of drosha n=1 Tax=Tachypleus tridentatus TaxID=6853 RepID=UPI003FCF4A46